MASKPKTAEVAATDNTVEERTNTDKPWLFKPGLPSANPRGRPKGSRNRLSENFISAMSDDFDQHGVSVIEAVRTEKPAEYLKIIAAIVPKEFTVNTVTLEDMSDDELIERLDQVRSIAASLHGAQARSAAKVSRGKTQPH